MKIMTVPARMEYLDKIMEMVENLLEQAGSSDPEKFHVLMAVEEIFTNIASYAYVEKDGEVRVSCGLNGEQDNRRIRITFCDWGIPYDPLKKQDPDFDIPLEERAIGGLGIFMVKTYMDHIEYGRMDDCNILTIEKNL